MVVNMELEEARKNIDKIDNEMRMLFIKRLEEVNKVIRYKKEHNLPILDVSREKEVIAPLLPGECVILDISGNNRKPIENFEQIIGK